MTGVVLWSRSKVMHERFRNKLWQVLYTIVAVGWVTSRFAQPHQLVGLLVNKSSPQRWPGHSMPSLVFSLFRPLIWGIWLNEAVYWHFSSFSSHLTENGVIFDRGLLGDGKLANTWNRVIRHYAQGFTRIPHWRISYRLLVIWLTHFHPPPNHIPNPTLIAALEAIVWSTSNECIERITRWWYLFTGAFRQRTPLAPECSLINLIRLRTVQKLYSLLWARTRFTENGSRSEIWLSSLTYDIFYIIIIHNIQVLCLSSASLINISVVRPTEIIITFAPSPDFEIVLSNFCAV